MKKLFLGMSLCTSILFLSGCGSSPTADVVDNSNSEGGAVQEGTEVAVNGDAAGENIAPTADPTKANLVVEAGDVISVNYIGALQSDESVFDTSLESVAKANDLYNPERPYEPLTFIVGAKQMIPGFDAGVVGMKIGDEKEISIPAAEGYGERTEELIQDLPAAPFIDAGIDPVVGEQYNFGVAPGTVLEISDDNLKVDFNHFLAGKDLKFMVTLVDIKKGEGLAALDTGAEEEPAPEE